MFQIKGSGAADNNVAARGRVRRHLTERTYANNNKNRPPSAGLNNDNDNQAQMATHGSRGATAEDASGNGRSGQFAPSGRGCLAFSPAFSLTGFTTIRDKVLLEMNSRAKTLLELKTEPPPQPEALCTQRVLKDSPLRRFVELTKPPPTTRFSSVHQREFEQQPSILDSPTRSSTACGCPESPTKRMRAVAGPVGIQPVKELAALSLGDRSRIAQAKHIKSKRERSPRRRHLDVNPTKPVVLKQPAFKQPAFKQLALKPPAPSQSPPKPSPLKPSPLKPSPLKPSQLKPSPLKPSPQLKPPTLRPPPLRPPNESSNHPPLRAMKSTGSLVRDPVKSAHSPRGVRPPVRSTSMQLLPLTLPGGDQEVPGYMRPTISAMRRVQSKKADMP